MDALVEVGNVGTDEGRVLPRCGVLVITEVEEEREHGLVGAFTKESRADELSAEVVVPNTVVGIGGCMTTEEGVDLGGDDDVTGVGEAASEGSGASVLGPADDEVEHLAGMVVVGRGVVVGGVVHDGLMKVGFVGSRREPRDANGRLGRFLLGWLECGVEFGPLNFLGVWKRNIVAQI